VAGIAAGIGLRIWVLSATALGSLDADEAVWGLMARHFLDGEWSTFFWGQTYGGSQESILTAAVFGIAGTGTLQLRVVPTVLYAVAAILVWRIGRWTVGEPDARIGAVLFWIWPAYFVWRSTKAYGFYGAGLVLGLLVVLLALRVREKPSRLEVLALGLALGLGWWATPQIVIVAVPALLWLLWHRPSVARLWWLALPGFAVGAFPWIVANVRNDWYSLRATPARTGALDHLESLFTAVLPTALGLRVPFSLEWIVGPIVGWALYALALAGFAWLVWRRPPGLALLILACLLFPIVYVVSPYSYLSVEPRYLALLTPVVALLLGWTLRGRWLATAGVAAAFALTLAGLVAMDRERLPVPRINEVLVPTDRGPLLRALEREQVETAFADYWVAYLIDFESRERIIATPAPDTGDVRSLRFDERVRRSVSPAHVFVRGAGRGARARPRLLRAGYRRMEADGFDVYVRPRTGPSTALRSRAAGGRRGESR
jgi:4-amino-4-deoxy-L-arabinose transferase-like glycosyltransferase